MTAREFLGDDNIKRLEELGFSPLAIRDLAKKEYETKRQSLIDKGISEGVAAQGAYENASDREIERMNDDASRGWIRRGWDDTKKAVLETVNAYSKFNDYGKDAENYLNKKRSGDEKAKFERKTKSGLSEYAEKEIKRIDKADERWAQAHPEEWNVAGAAGGLVGGFIDPINFIPLSSSAKWGKKILYYAGTGAAAGGVSAYGGDRNVGEGAAAGAIGGAFLGPLMEYGINGISKLVAKRRANRAANEADAIDHAENSDFLSGGAGGATGGELKTAQTMTAREFATSEAGLDEATAIKVVKEATQGKEKSDFVDAGTYADIVNFKKFENQRDYARAYGEQIEAAKTSLNNAREQSAVRYSQTQKAINEYQKQGMSASATKELINAKFKPGVDEINYTRAYNDGADVDPRLAGQGIFYAIEKDIAAQAYTPEIYAARLKQRGFSDESAQAFTQAYVQKDINIAKDWANGKAAEAYEEQIRKQAAAEIKAKNEVEGERAPIEDANSFLKESAKHKASERERMSGAYPASDASDGHIVKDGTAAKQYAEHKFEPEKWINDLSGVLSDEWAANLKSLALKHPEMFKSEADVFRVIKEIKDNPTHFFKNNRDDAALISKELKDEKAGNIVIKKDDGEIVHVNKTRKSDLARLQRNNEKALEGTPTPSILDAEINPAQTRRFAATPNDEIILQKGNLVNEKEANGLRDSVSSIGDNASRAGGRQAGDEQILRQGRSDTPGDGEAKRRTKSDEQMEQRPAFKTDGDTDAAVATKQVVEKQEKGDRTHGEFMIRLVKSHAHKDFANEKAYFDHTAKHGGDDLARFDMDKLKEERAEIEQAFNITPIKEFGTNYAEFYHDGKGAANKLMAEKQGQVAGAFYRKELGDIDLVWGNEQIGLNKILLKHESDFEELGGVASGLEKIVKGGELKDKNGAKTIFLNKDGKEFKIGLSKGWNGKGDNEWIITAYEFKKTGSDKTSDFAAFTSKRPLENRLENIIPQNLVKEPAGVKEDFNNFKQAYKLMKKNTANFESRDFDNIANLDAKAFEKRLKDDIQGYEELVRLHDMAHRGAIGLLDADEYLKYFGVKQYSMGYLSKAGKVEEEAFDTLDFSIGYLNGIYKALDRLPKAGLDSAAKKQIDDALSSVNFYAIRGVVENPGYRNLATKMKTEFNKLIKAKKIYEKAVKESGGLPKTKHFINSNAHLGSGLMGGTLNSVDEDGNFSPERFATGFLIGLAGSKAVSTGLRKMTPKLYNKILGAAEKMPQMANGNPRLLGKLYSNGKDVSLNSFAGEKAITANVGKLDQAKAMLEKGADEVEIWQKTGWFKDKDGAWKFEIGDGNARLNPGFQSGGRLGELLEHEELFKAYPELKDVRVVKIGDETPDGAALSVRDAAQKEKRGIYNVTYNDKTATLVRQDLDDINSALLYERGDKEVGAKHTRIRHLRDENKVGYVKDTELLNLGENIRAFTKKYEEPFIDKRGARIYEWQDENGVRFRVVVDNRRGNGQTPPPASESIITFYSDRNLKDSMDFKNPKVKYDVNLKEWHKDSAPITKNSDGSPKVFYHGSKAKDITEFKDKFDKSGYGFWFNQSKSAAVEFKQDGKIYQVYINVKNPIDLSFPYSQKAKNLFDEAERLGIDTELYPENQSDAFKKFLEQKGYDGIVMDDLDGAAKHPHVIVFNSNQIKHVKNDGNFSDSPNIYKSGKEGYYSPANNEIGLSDLGDKSTLMHEVQHAIQGVEDFARGGDFNTVWNVAAKNIEKKYESELARLEKISNDAWGKHAPLQKEYIKLFDDGLKDTPEAQRLLKQMRAFSDEGSRADHEIRELRQAANAEKNAITEETLQENYRKIHGEAEARNVQNRLNLDGKAHPHETFDVNPNETIVSKGDEVSYSRKIEEIKREHPNVERELDESIAAMRKESFNDSNFKAGLMGKFDTKEIITQELGKSVNLSDKQLAVLKNDIKNADFKVINESKIYFDKIGKDGDKKRFFVDIAQDGSLRVDAYAKSQIDNIPVKQSALEELAGTGDAARLKGMSFEVKAAYRNELDPIKKEAILKTAELNKLKKAAQSGDKAAVAKFEEFKAKNLDENGNIKDGLSLC